MDAKIDAKVPMFNREGEKLGKIFRRRAVQLVSKQRAEWTDQEQSAIRFTADSAPEDGLFEAIPLDDEGAEVPAEKDDGFLYALAEKRLKEKRLFIWHSVLFLPVVVVFLIIFAWGVNYLRILNEWGFTVQSFSSFLSGGWFTIYVIHIIAFAKNRTGNRSNFTKRRMVRLEEEVSRLKRMGY